MDRPDVIDHINIVLFLSPITSTTTALLALLRSDDVSLLFVSLCMIQMVI